MTKANYVFVMGRFREDLNQFLEGSSLRKLCDLTDGEVSFATLGRISAGKSHRLDINTMATVCSAIGKNPCDYIDRVLF